MLSSKEVCFSLLCQCFGKHPPTTHPDANFTVWSQCLIVFEPRKLVLCLAWARHVCKSLVRALRKWAGAKLRNLRPLASGRSVVWREFCLASIIVYPSTLLIIEVCLYPRNFSALLLLFATSRAWAMTLKSAVVVAWHGWSPMHISPLLVYALLGLVGMVFEFSVSENFRAHIYTCEGLIDLSV